MCLHAHDAALFYLTADPLKGFLKEIHTAKSIFDWRFYIFFQGHMADKLPHILLPGHHYEAVLLDLDDLLNPPSHFQAGRLFCLWRPYRL